jgi:hypothetical protein
MAVRTSSVVSVLDTYFAPIGGAVRLKLLDLLFQLDHL